MWSKGLKALKVDSGASGGGDERVSMVLLLRGLSVG